MRLYLHIILTISLSTFSLAGWAQELSLEEQLQIMINSKDLIRDLEELLNELANSETNERERAFLIETSYQEGRNQIFFDEEIIVENDLDPSYKHITGNERDMSIKRYLNYFDLFYEKSDSLSVYFEEITPVSEIAKGAYYYLHMGFKRKLHNRHKEELSHYTPSQRIAEIRLEMINNRWIPYIVSITYPDSLNSESTLAEHIPTPSPDNDDLNPDNSLIIDASEMTSGELTKMDNMQEVGDEPLGEELLQGKKNKGRIPSVNSLIDEEKRNMGEQITETIEDHTPLEQGHGATIIDPPLTNQKQEVIPEANKPLSQDINQKVTIDHNSPGKEVEQNNEPQTNTTYQQISESANPPSGIDETIPSKSDSMLEYDDSQVLDASGQKNEELLDHSHDTTLENIPVDEGVSAGRPSLKENEKIMIAPAEGNQEIAIDPSDKNSSGLSEDSFQFIAPRRAEKFKKGNTLDIRWIGPVRLDIPLTIAVLNDGNRKTLIRQGERASSFSWLIPKKLESGQYRIYLYHGNTQELVGKSDPFLIK